MENLWKILDIDVKIPNNFGYPTFIEAYNACQKVFKSLKEKVVGITDEDNTGIGLASIAAFQESKQKAFVAYINWSDECKAHNSAFTAGVNAIENEFLKSKSGILFSLDYEIKTILQPIIKSVQIDDEKSNKITSKALKVGKSYFEAGRDYESCRIVGIDSGLIDIHTHISKIRAKYIYQE